MKATAAFTREENLREAQAMADLFFTVYNSPKPVVARVHGAALGGGSGLVAACDIAVAALGTQFGFTEVRLGILPAVISPYVVAKIGESAARELFLTGRALRGGARPQEIGLVRAAVPEADLDTAVESAGLASCSRPGPARWPRPRPSSARWPSSAWRTCSATRSSASPTSASPPKPRRACALSSRSASPRGRE